MKHIDRWFAFARGLGLGIEKMKEIILVTGYGRRTNVAFFGNDSEYDTQVTFGVKVDHHCPDINNEWPGQPPVQSTQGVQYYADSNRKIPK